MNINVGAINSNIELVIAAAIAINSYYIVYINSC
jgi:hypothetical protein